MAERIGLVKVEVVEVSEDGWRVQLIKNIQIPDLEISFK